MLLENGVPTKLKKDGVIGFDIVSGGFDIRRGEQGLCCLIIAPDGMRIDKDWMNKVVDLLSSACGFGYEEIKQEVSDGTYRFKII